MKPSYKRPCAGRAATNKLAAYTDEIMEVVRGCPDTFTARQFGKAAGCSPGAIMGFVAAGIVQIVEKGDHSGTHKHPTTYRLAGWVPGWLEERERRMGAA